MAQHKFLGQYTRIIAVKRIDDSYAWGRCPTDGTRLDFSYHGSTATCPVCREVYSSPEDAQE